MLQIIWLFYGANSSGSDSNPRLLVQEAIDAAETAGVDFSIYDNDNDGNVDGIIVIHAGYGEEAGGVSNTIWSHHWTLGTYQRTYDGVTIDDYAIVPELRNNFGSNITNIGVICHEFGHSLGLPDLYDTNTSDGDSEGIGEWGLMGSGNWNNNGASPSNICAWSKVFLSWSNPVVLSSPLSILLPNSAQNNTLYRVNTPHANEYFLLENRQFVGFDIGLPGTGLAIWHVNTSKTTTSHIDDNDVNADESLKGVDLEEADGNLDLDSNTNRGDDGDLFPGSSCNLSFGDNTTPNSRTYSPVVNTNKQIENIIESGNNIRFDFMGYNPISGPSLICTSATFTITNPPDGATVSWDESSNLTEDPQNPGTLTANGSGDGWVEATLSTGCGDITLPRNEVWVGTPNHDNISITGDDWVVPKNSIFMATAFEEMYIDDYQWDLPYGFNITMGQGTYTIRFNAPSGFGSDYYGLQLHNTCGTSGRNYMMYEAPFKSVLIVSPNPTNGETTVSIEPEVTQDESLKSASTQPTLDENTVWDMEVYDSMQSLKLKKQKLKGKSTRINTQSWKEDVYMVRVQYNGEILTGKLVVKR